MEIHEITCNADADTLIAEYIRSTQADANLMENLEDKVDEWTEEFDSLDREVKVRKSEDINHYKLNMIIGLYFLIPVALFYIKNWKEIRTNEDIPLLDSEMEKKLYDLWDDDDDTLWNDTDKDDYFPSEPE